MVGVFFRIRPSFECCRFSFQLELVIDRLHKLEDVVFVFQVVAAFSDYLTIAFGGRLSTMTLFISLTVYSRA